MTNQAVQFIDFNFQTGNAILKNSPNNSKVDTSFAEVFGSKVKEATRKEEEKASELIDSKDKNKKKKTSKNNLIDITKIIENKERYDNNGTKATYSLLNKLKNSKSNHDEDPFKQTKKAQMHNPNAVGHAEINPNQHRSSKRFTKAQLLSAWERMAPTVTEDAMKKSVRIDIPLLNDVKALVLRMHGDRSISASILGSEVMGELIKKHQNKLDDNLKHHHLNLREFKFYRTELDLNSESGTRKKKGKKQSSKTVDLI